MASFVFRGSRKYQRLPLASGAYDHGLAQVRGRLEEYFQVRVVGHGTSAARFVGSSLLKMPEPTKTPSMPSCIIKAASAGVANRRAAKFTTGKRPSSATCFTELVGRLHLLGGHKEFIFVHGREHLDLLLDGSRVSDALDDVSRCRPRLRPRSMTRPPRLYVKPRPVRRHLQTKGTVNLFLLMWLSSSAIVSTSLSSM